MFPIDIPYKFPRLSGMYEILVAVGDTEEQAEFRAEQKLVKKGVYRPLDKIIHIHETRSGFPFEAVLHFLHPKFENSMTALEKQYVQGILSKLSVVDDDSDSLEKVIDGAVARGVYEVKFCDNPRAVIEFVRDNSCDVLVMRHNMSGNNGFQVAQRLSKMNLLPKIVVYGNVPRKTIDYYYSTRFALYVVKQHDVSLILSAVENVLNNVRANHFSDFVLP
ncbi:response regulator [Candidatus Woesearchaeota archaeon]|nr:response regulator [Candidatus Woesearchaeota archaeon]